MEAEEMEEAAEAEARAVATEAATEAARRYDFPRALPLLAREAVVHLVARLVRQAWATGNGGEHGGCSQKLLERRGRRPLALRYFRMEGRCLGGVRGGGEGGAAWRRNTLGLRLSLFGRGFACGWRLWCLCSLVAFLQDL